MDHFDIDAYRPDEMARRVASAGVAKTELAPLPLVTLALLAGAFIAFGAMLYTVAMTGAEPGFGPARILGGLAFSLGLVLVVVGGAELFTGDALLVMAWAERRVTTAALLRVWAVVLLGNFVGASATVLAMHLAGGLAPVAETAAAIAAAKTDLAPVPAFLRGVLCNVLVCLAVWLSFAGRSVVDKAVAVIFPITAFVALGFEHSIANMYLIPAGMLAPGGPGLDLAAYLGNLVPVTLGNIVGGGALVAGVYWLIYLRRAGRR